MSGSQIKQPEVTIAIANADVAVENTPQRVLIVGQKNGGSAASGALVQNIGNAREEDALFGEDSQIAASIRAFKEINQVNRLDAIGLDDAGGGTDRDVDFTLAGTATAAGTVTVVYGSERNAKAEIAVAVGDTETDVAAAIVAAITADTRALFDAANVAGAVTLTAVNAGTVANQLGVQVIVAATGLSISVALADTPGATDPTLTGVLDVATERYQGIVWPYSDTTELAAFLGPRFNATNDILDGVGFAATVDSLSNHLSALGALNDQNLVFVVDKAESVVTGDDQYIGPAQNEAGFVKTAYFTAIRALRLTDGQNVASFVTSRASRDQTGGIASASLPYFNTPIAQLPLIPAGFGWTQSEIQQLFDAGGTVFGVNIGGNTGLVGEVVTTYKTDAASNPDPTFQFLNYVDTETNIREYRFNNLKARYAQSRLTSGALSRNRDVANEASIRAFVERLYQDTSGDDFVLTVDGDDAFAFYKANLDISLDLATGSVTITDLTPIVTQLRRIVMTMKITFSVGS